MTAVVYIFKAHHSLCSFKLVIQCDSRSVLLCYCENLFLSISDTKVFFHLVNISCMCSMICHRHGGWRESWRHTSNKQYCKTSCYVLKSGRMIGIYGVVFFVRFIGIACSCRCWALTFQLLIKKWQFLLSRLNGAKFCERKHTEKFDFSFNNGNSSKPSICTSNAAWRKFMQLMLTLCGVIIAIIHSLKSIFCVARGNSSLSLPLLYIFKLFFIL